MPSSLRLVSSRNFSSACLLDQLQFDLRAPLLRRLHRRCAVASAFLQGRQIGPLHGLLLGQLARRLLRKPGSVRPTRPLAGRVRCCRKAAAPAPPPAVPSRPQFHRAAPLPLQSRFHAAPASRVRNAGALQIRPARRAARACSSASRCACDCSSSKSARDCSSTCSSTERAVSFSSSSR